MRQLVYALRWRGTAIRAGPDGNVLKIASHVTSCTIATRIDAAGLSSSLQPGSGEGAGLESELTFTGATTFQQAGTIEFGPSAARHRIRFSTVGSGHLEPAVDRRRGQGAAIWRVEGGEGQFAGASGLIVSTFHVDDAGELTDHHVGVISVQPSAGGRGSTDD